MWKQSPVSDVCVRGDAIHPMPSRHPYPIRLHFHAHIHNRLFKPNPPTFTRRTTKITLRPQASSTSIVSAKFVAQLLPIYFPSCHHRHDSFFFFTPAALALLLAGGLCVFVWKQSRYRAVRRATRKVSSHSDLRDIMDGAAAGSEVLLGLAQAQADGEVGGRFVRWIGSELTF